MQLVLPFVLRYWGKEVAQIVSEGVAIATCIPGPFSNESAAICEVREIWI